MPTQVVLGHSRVGRLLRSPVTQFLLASAITAVCILLVSQWLAGRAATEEAIGEARRSTRLVADTFIEPNLPPSLHGGSARAADQLAGVVKLDRFDNVARIAIWSAADDERRRLNFPYPDGPDVYQPLAEAETRVLDGEDVVSERVDPQNMARALTLTRPGPPSGDLLRTITGVRDLEGNPMLLEVYYSLDDIEQRRAEIYGSFRWIAVGALAVMMIVTVPLLRVLTRRLTRAGRERTRLLERAIDASDRERRRIARDLHDGVVQDLAGTGFAISAVARDPAVPQAAGRNLEAAGASLRDSMRGLRSLLTEIHPPDPRAEGLGAGLEDLTATAEAAGVAAAVEVTGMERASDGAATVVWRVAQEAVRNVLRHAGASTLAVTVRGRGDVVVLEVVDDGRGFEPDAERADTHFGLRGMHGLVADHGGTLRVHSAPGQGTRVTMEVDAR
jgi:two-component system NarL family sensor kinase